MAVKYSELNKIDKRPLTEEELAMVSAVEAYIDSEILKQFKTKSEVWIFLGIANFEWDPVGEAKVSHVKPIRKKMMAAELAERYKKAEWKITYHLDDGLDGPNRSGADYFILTGNRI